MFLKITTRKYNGKEKNYATITQSYKVGKKTKHKPVLYLGHVKTNEDMKRFTGILKSMQTGNEFVNLRNISAKSAKEYGVTYMAGKILEKYGIDEILKKHLSKSKSGFDAFELVKALVINRLIRPSSELSAYERISKHYAEKLDVQKHHLYRSLDYLKKEKEEIERDIFDKLKQELNLDISSTFYDLTSSYFEGTCCNIAMFGHSRDHRKDRRQIVIGLVMCDGIPVMHEIHKGNIVDKATLKLVQENLKKNFGIEKSAIIADAGIFTETNAQFLEDESYEYVLGLHRRNMNISKELLAKEFVSCKDHDAIEAHREEITRNDKKFIRRYIICLDNNTRKDRLENLGIIKKNMEKKLKELQEKFKKSQASKKGKKMNRDSLMQQVFKSLGKNKRLFNVEFDNVLVFSLNKENWEYENKIAGKFILVTNTAMKPDEAMKAYKQLQTVENAFDEIKNFLDVRPIFHKKDIRVRAHVFVCVLSFLIERLIERFASETARKVIDEMSVIRIVEFDVKGNEKKMITEISKEAESMFKELKIPVPTSHQSL